MRVPVRRGLRSPRGRPSRSGSRDRAVRRERTHCVESESETPPHTKGHHRVSDVIADDLSRCSTVSTYSSEPLCVPLTETKEAPLSLLTNHVRFRKTQGSCGRVRWNLPKRALGGRSTSDRFPVRKETLNAVLGAVSAQNSSRIVM